MKKPVNLLILLAIASLNLFSTNHMDLLFRIDGEFNGSYMGHTMVSLDYNGDGYDDLIASAFCWNPTGVFDTSALWGKLYFYMGGPGFDDVADYAFPAEWVKQFRGYLDNAGDVNGDGKEDFLMFTFPRNIPGETGEFFSLYVFYGKEVPTGQPDYIFNVAYDSAEYPDYTHNFFAFPMGDINNDGFDDIGLRYLKAWRSFEESAILLGSSNGPNEHILFPSNYGPQSFMQLNGIGDVNADGADDFHLSSQGAYGRRLSVFFGSDTFPELDSLIVSDDYQGVTVYEACPVGDVNGDETDDFFLHMNGSAKIWFGNSDLSPAWDVELEAGYFGDQGSLPILRHGDFNGDGYEDIVGTNPGYAYWDGKVGIWLGGAQFNGTVDLTIYAPQYGGMQFGWGKAAGDFNGDGYCDLAVSSPFFYGAPALIPGFIYIYAGNGELKDTTVGIEDEYIPEPDSDIWDLNVYPNPGGGGKISIALATADRRVPDRVQVYNLKGQILLTSETKVSDWQAGNIELEIPGLTNGIYLIRVSNQQGNQTTKRVIITK